MAPSALPRYFVARADADQSAVECGEFEPGHAIDTFVLSGRGAPELEWLVATDLLGSLGAIPESEWDRLPPRVRGEVGYHEVSGGRSRRRLDVEDLFLFDVELLEQPAQSSGWNDPVYLYGTLYGVDTALGVARGVEGQLTVTRCDVLEGIAHGADYAFRVADPDGPESRDGRCMHMLLPGDTDEATRRGSGLVLAYPLLPAELGADDTTNEIVVSRLLYDLLVALKEDLERERVDHPLRSTDLPVPSRFVLEQELVAKGYRISGDTAIKSAERVEGMRGLVVSALGSLLDDEVALPRQADVGEFVAIAASALARLPGWPSPRAAAIRARVAGPTSTPRVPHVLPPRPGAPTGQGAPQAPPVLRRPTPVRVRRSDEPPAWMQDFISAHRAAGAPPPRLTTARAPGGTEGASGDAKDAGWMRDFGRTSAPTKPTPAPKDDPDWMKDFE